MEETTYYCYLDSTGTTSTNLQLYSLKKAYEELHKLKEDYKQHGDKTKDLKERMVFITVCLGLSLSQLLGQNAKITKQKIDNPDALLATFLHESKYGNYKKRLLNKKFKNLVGYYDACRHFGRDYNNKKWKKVDTLNIEKVKEFMQTTLDIWNAVIGHHRSEYVEVDDIKDIL